MGVCVDAYDARLHRRGTRRNPNIPYLTQSVMICMLYTIRDLDVASEISSYYSLTSLVLYTVLQYVPRVRTVRGGGTNVCK